MFQENIPFPSSDGRSQTSTLKVEAVCSSETLVPTYHITNQKTTVSMLLAFFFAFVSSGKYHTL
jgi:hypothetical protein